MGFINIPISFIPAQPVRQIGTIHGYVTVNESSSDVLTVTKQPVQQGASITDHAYLEPAQFSGKFLFQSGITNLFTSLSQLYQNLLDLQKSMTPFTIVTPKRVYQSMLMTALSQTTDRSTENILSVNASFQQIIIVSISTANVPRQAQAQADITGATQKAGQKSSALFNLATGVQSAFKVDP